MSGCADFDHKKDFFDFGESIYLNCATQGPLPRVSVAAAREALELETQPHRITDEMYFSVPDDYRRAVAPLVGVDPAQVAVTDSTTHGVMLVVNGLDWRPGDEVVLPAGEFPANRFPWLYLERRGVVVKEADLGGDSETNGPERLIDRLEAAISARTRVASLAWVSYRDGTRRDLAAVGELCRAKGVLFVVDGSQGVGGLELDLAETSCDLLACSGYKWMLGPYGLGFAWVSAELGDRLELGNVNWFAIRGARDFNRLSECELEFEPGARRFDVNETANFIALAAGTASARYLVDVGVGRAEAHVQRLLARLLTGLPAGFRPLLHPADGASSNLLFLVGESRRETEAARDRLRSRRISVGWREGAIRVSPFVFNDDTDIDRLLDALAG